MAPSLTRPGDARDGGMGDPASLADVTRGPTCARPVQRPAGAADEPALHRLALWLADVAVEAAQTAKGSNISAAVETEAPITKVAR